MTSTRAALASWTRTRRRTLARRIGPKPLARRGGGRIEGVVPSAREWAADTPGAAYEPIVSAERYARRPPRSETPEGDARYEVLRVQDNPEAFRVLVPRGRLVGFHAPLVLTSDRRVVLESAYPHVRSRPPRRRLLHPVQRLEGRYMVLINEWWDNHFHWLVDLLPRASLLPVHDDRDALTPIIVPARLSAAQLESLAMIGIPRERLIAFDHLHLQADELILPSFVGRPGFPPPWAASWLRDRLSPERSAERRRLWISRAGVDRGRTENEGAVIELLERYGFETLQPDGYPFAEQARLFGSAELIVAPHGSGLSNIVAAHDATVIELQSERWWGQGCYYSLADALGLDYWYVTCDATRWGHLMVDVAFLQRTIDAALRARADSGARGR